MNAGDGSDGWFVLRPSGRLNRSASAGLRQELEQLIRTGAVNIVVSFAEVESVDAACLGALLACRKRALECGGDVLISHPNKQVIAVLAMTNLDQILRCCGSSEDRLAQPC